IDGDESKPRILEEYALFQVPDKRTVVALAESNRLLGNSPLGDITRVHDDTLDSRLVQEVCGHRLHPPIATVLAPTADQNRFRRSWLAQEWAEQARGALDIVGVQVFGESATRLRELLSEQSNSGGRLVADNPHLVDHSDDICGVFQQAAE